MNHKDYEHLSKLASLNELPGERDKFIQSLIPFYDMMEKVRNAALEEETGFSEMDTAEEEPVLELREDLPHAYTDAGCILEQSERRDEAYFTVPRSI